ncbi:hypothetical protein KOR34_45200 [Posidoniimonas corsicana]|uniref:Uncharacterized protein n=1 Tax=Posidoniimonas corsicana TaxID=1938618 RepID=A0A5C5UXR6_9BACT|nr:hypothetical protein [Posidoniimonas corsicana]TWT31144.1 hypothetical protein KOR34_45200 [Posidoniimonas corsicana]
MSVEDPGCVLTYDPRSGAFSINTDALRAMESLESLPATPTPAGRLTVEQRHGLAAKLTLAACCDVLITYDHERSERGSARSAIYDLRLPSMRCDSDIQLPLDCCVDADEFDGDLVAAILYELQRVANQYQELVWRVEDMLGFQRFSFQRLKGLEDEEQDDCEPAPTRDLRHLA